MIKKTEDKLRGRIMITVMSVIITVTRRIIIVIEITEMKITRARAEEQ